MTLKFDQAIFHNGNFVLGPLDLQFRSAAVTVVIGPNGSGKSTLLRAAAGLLSAHSGGARLQPEQPRSAHAQLEHPQLAHPQFEHSNSARANAVVATRSCAHGAFATRALAFIRAAAARICGGFFSANFRGVGSSGHARRRASRAIGHATHGN